MRFLADENFPLPSIQCLRQAGYDVASISEDSWGIEDVEVLARSVDEQRFILTFCSRCGEEIFSREDTEGIRWRSLTSGESMLHGKPEPIKSIFMDVFSYQPESKVA